MELIAGIFQKRKPGESHFSLNVERKQSPRLRAKSEWPHALGEGYTEHFKLLFPYLSVDTFYFTFLKQVYFYPGTHAVLFPSLFLVEPSRKTLYLSIDDPCLSVRTGLSIACASWRLSFFFIIIFFIFYFFWHLC